MPEEPIYEGDVAIVRIEQLAPLPKRRLGETLGRYPNVCEYFWLQEGPANQGAWPRLGLELPDKMTGIKRISRPRHVGAVLRLVEGARRQTAGHPQRGVHLSLLPVFGPNGSLEQPIYTRAMSSPKRPPVLFSLLAPRLVKWYSKSNVAIYRATGGRIGGRELGLPVCLLTTTGRRSGLARTSALVFMRDGDRVVLVAAQGGLPTHPQWLLNLRANPEVHVQIRAEVHTMRARVVDDAQRAQLWPRLTAMNPRWARFQSWTDRVIPVVVCEPA